MDPKKVSAIINVKEHMVLVETRAWEKNRGISTSTSYRIPAETDICRLCGNRKEGAMHLISGCKVLAGNE